MISELQLAWAAGLIEGEGYLQLTPQNRDVGIAVTSIDLDVLQKLQAILGGSVCGPYDHGNPKWKPFWRWQIGARPTVRSVLNLILPYLCSRRKAKAVELLAWIEENPRAQDRSHCKNGHDYANGNLYIAPSGTRNCRICRKAAVLRLAAKRKSLGLTSKGKRRIGGI